MIDFEGDEKSVFAGLPFTVIMSTSIPGDSSSVVASANANGEVIFNNFLYQFLNFRVSYGSNAVPSVDNAGVDLVRWVKDVSDGRTQLMLGCHSWLTLDQKRVLDSINFPWVRGQKERFAGHFNQLVAFRETNGHSDVPQNNGELGVWVKNLRAEYKHYMSGNSTTLTPALIERFEAIDFKWSVKVDAKKSWDNKYELMKSFYYSKGHSNVPRRDSGQFSGSGLGRWASEQRNQYKKFMIGDDTKLNEDRIKKLTDIKFDWKYKDPKK